MCTASPKFMELAVWNAASIPYVGLDQESSALPALYNHRMARVNFTAYSFGGMDGNYPILSNFTLQTDI